AEWLVGSKPVEDVFEFRLSRRKLFAGESGGLHAVAPDDRELGVFMTQPFDPLERRPHSGTRTQSAGEFQSRILDTCHHCHGAPGVQSLAAARTLFGQGACTAVKFYATSAEEQAEATLEWKQRQYNWGFLQGLWLSNADQTSSPAGPARSSASDPH
ncbi:MAG TPA: hypothetical protein VHM88_17545, partial [Candidatus Acidoferrales bacterium]|nr:hypothetical protein [Candidatus Acidoferrales bacterium]